MLAHERINGQLFGVDVMLHVDTRLAATTDDLADTVDYGDLARRIAAVIDGEPVSLIETLADRLAAACLSDPRVERAEVTVHKPEAPVGVAFGDVAVCVVRP